MVTNRCLQYTGRLHLSTITLGELYTWTNRANASPKRAQALNAFLNDVHLIDFNSQLARQFGKTRAALLDQGLPAPDMDLLIAATALFHGLTLVTHNASDYANVPRLSLADWMVP